MAAEKTYTVERQTVVAAPPERLRAELEDLRRWQAWSPWEGLDPALARTYTGPDAGPGAAYAWSGNRKAGRGRMSVLESTPAGVSIAIAFEKPFPSTSTSTFLLEPLEAAAGGGASTRVTWRMTGPRPLAMRLLGPLLTMDGIVGKDFEKGLARLRTVAEAPPR